MNMFSSKAHEFFMSFFVGYTALRFFSARDDKNTAIP